LQHRFQQQVSCLAMLVEPKTPEYGVIIVHVYVTPRKSRLPTTRRPV
jgi:hypothetical protein